MEITRWLVCAALAAGCGASRAPQPSAAKHPRARIIHPAQPGGDCVEMYGSCTQPPNPVCTSYAFVLSCGQSGAHPRTGEWLTCVCP